MFGGLYQYVGMSYVFIQVWGYIIIWFQHIFYYGHDLGYLIVFSLIFFYSVLLIVTISFYVIYISLVRVGCGVMCVVGEGGSSLKGK